MRQAVKQSDAQMRIESSQEPQPREQWALFTMATVIACTVVLVMELRENAAGVDFNGPLTDSCHYRVDYEGHYCAAALSVNPFFGPVGPVLIKMGGVVGHRIVEHNDLWRLGAAIFLHAGVVHYGINMLALIGIGRQLEHSHGPARIGPIYILSGLFGSIASATFAPDVLSVGASGAIFGLIGGCVGDVLLNWDLYRRPCVALLWLLFLSFFQFVLGTMPLVDNFAHTFGFIMGLISSLVLLRRLNPSQRCAATCGRRLMRLLVACCVALAFAAGLGLLYGVDGQDANELCPQCSKISCMPFPWGCDAATPDTCWWTCNTTSIGAPCTGEASYVGHASNGTVALTCPSASEPTALHPVDVTGWSSQYLALLCKDHCS